MLNRRHPIDIIQAIPKRYKESHKGTYGRLLIIAGSRRYTGAATLMVEAALRAGVGMVTVVATHDTAQVIRIRAPEAIVVEAPESNGGFDKAAISTIRECAHDMNVTAVGIGPGLGALKSATDFYDGIDELIRECTWPVLIDADAMAPLYERCVRQPLDDHRLVFTPHPKEFLTMVNQTELNEKNRDVLVACKAIRQTIVYKTNGSIVGSSDGIWQSKTGNEGLATAGSGDVLSGMISSLLAQGSTPVHAAKLGVYMHGLASEIASADLGLRSIIASDLCQYIPKTFQELVQYHG